MGSRYVSVFVGGMVVLLVVGATQADPSWWSFSEGTLAAEVIFDVVGGDKLSVTLTNTSTYDVVEPSQVLTGVVFDMPGVALTPLSVELTDGSSVLWPELTATGTGVDINGEIGGEYAYRSDLTGVFSDPAHVLSAVGMGGVVGPPDLFPGGALFPPTSPNGISYGLVSGADDPTTGNTHVTGNVPLVQNSVTFLLGGFDGDLSSILGVQYNYGSAFDLHGGPEPPVVPAPPAVLAGLLGLTTLGGCLGRSRLRSQAA